MYRLPAAVFAAILAGCASVPAGRQAAVSNQPLRHLAVTPVAPEEDVLAMKLSGQFALESGDVAKAAHEFAR
ncbi:MAG: hypothetical protein ACM3KT_02185, partial [Deltaproteobacteria bacterium]